MKRMMVAAVMACFVLFGPADGALAVPPNPIREAAQLDQTCPILRGASELSTHGTYVSGVTLGIYGSPTDPYEPCVPIVVIED